MKISISNIVAHTIVATSIVLGAQIIHAGQPTKVLYVAVEAPATAAAPAERLPIRLAGYGDSSMEWGLANGFVTLASMRADFTWDSNDARADRDSFAELGCSLVDDEMLQQHAGGDARGEGWAGVGNDNASSCAWGSSAADVVIASWGPTSAYDRRPIDGPVTSIEDPTFRARLLERMDEFETFVGSPVLWITWHDEPSPANREALYAELLDTRACSFDLSTLHLDPSDYDDGIHLSPQGSLTVAAALIPAAKECLP